MDGRECFVCTWLHSVSRILWVLWPKLGAILQDNLLRQSVRCKKTSNYLCRWHWGHWYYHWPFGAFIHEDREHAPFERTGEVHMQWGPDLWMQRWCSWNISDRLTSFAIQFQPLCWVVATIRSSLLILVLTVQLLLYSLPQRRRYYHPYSPYQEVTLDSELMPFVYCGWRWAGSHPDLL